MSPDSPRPRTSGDARMVTAATVLLRGGSFNDAYHAVLRVHPAASAAQAADATSRARANIQTAEQLEFTHWGAYERLASGRLPSYGRYHEMVVLVEHERRPGITDEEYQRERYSTLRVRINAGETSREIFRRAEISYDQLVHAIETGMGPQLGQMRPLRWTVHYLI